MESAIRELIQQEKQTFFFKHQHLSESQRRQLWTQRLASLTSDNVSSPRPQDARIPRTLSYGGPSSIRNSTLGIDTHNSMNRTQGLSVQSAPAAVSMSRSPSSYSANDDAFSYTDAYTVSPNSTFSSNQSNMQAIHEYDVTEYIDTCIGPSAISARTPSISIGHDYNSQPISMPSTWGPSLDGSISPCTSTSGELTPASTLTSDMSRETSYCTQFGGISLARNHSSFSSDSLSEEHLYPSPNVKTISESDTEPSHFLDLPDFADRTMNPISGTIFHSPQFPYGASALVPSSSLQLESSDLVEDMKRSTSISSNKSSTSSTSSRHSRRRAQQLAHGARPIAPKAIAKHSASRHASTSSQTKMMRVHSTDGSSKELAQITKAPYIRPQHPKVMCPHCAENPEGFRGEHELRRHTERAHARVRKMWVTVDASPDKTFLANCKQCRAGKKYGAYYNVAAHLRRAHFHPRKRGRKGKHDEKRGGKGGGDDPPMEVLKRDWIREIQVDATTTQSNDGEDDDALDQDSIDDMPTSMQYTDANAYQNYDYDAAYPTLPTLDYGNQFAEVDFATSLANPYPQQLGEFDLQPDMNVDATAALCNFDFDAQQQYDLQ